VIRLATDIGQVELRELQETDADRYYEVVDRNRQHLSRYGDYLAERDATLASVIEYFAAPPDHNIRLGVWHAGALIGRVDLNPVEPPRYAIGYWLDQAHCGRGFATSACAAAIGYAHRVLGATDIYAGVTHGDARSAALLHRLGFQRIADFDAYSRFHLALDQTTRR
jgi:ribosomal-protein-serine acetyltransferase